jgi:hypothetical protein
MPEDDLMVAPTPLALAWLEEHVIFGGEKKLRKLIRSTMDLVDGDLYVVLS